MELHPMNRNATNSNSGGIDVTIKRNSDGKSKWKSEGAARSGASQAFDHSEHDASDGELAGGARRVPLVQRRVGGRFVERQAARADRPRGRRAEYVPVLCVRPFRDWEDDWAFRCGDRGSARRKVEFTEIHGCSYFCPADRCQTRPCFPG